MPKHTKTYILFIAAPSDITDEKECIRELVAEWNRLQGEARNIRLEVQDWQSHSFPLYGKRGQAIINEQVLNHADIVVGLFWTRFGSPTGAAASGTEEEILSAIEQEKHLMLYFSDKPVNPSMIDNQQYDKVKAFRKTHQDMNLYVVFDSIKAFESKFRDDISRIMYRITAQQQSNSHKKSEPAAKETDETGQAYARVEDISALLKKNFKVYWAKLYGIIEEGENVLPNGMKISRSGKNKDELKQLQLTIEHWEERIRDYSNHLQVVLSEMDEYSDDEFKNEIFAKELWTVKGALKNPERELDRYRHSFKEIEAYRVREVVKNIILVCHDYVQNIAPPMHNHKVQSPEDLQLSVLAQHETLLTGVIGKGIRSEIMHKLYPGIFTLMTRRSIWGLYFLSDESDEFVVDDKYEGRFRTVHNWDYLYDHFTFYNNFIYQMMCEYLSKHNIKLKDELKYGYVNLLLVAIENTHEQEINKLKTPKKVEI